MITGHSVSTGDHILVEAAKDGTIRHVDSLLPGHSVEDAADVWVAPGFIDLQVNGFAGVDFNSPESPQEKICEALNAIFTTGVTSILPTIITGPPEKMLAVLRHLTATHEMLGPVGQAIDGFHMEGPHLSREDGPRGAHPSEWVREPSYEEFRHWQEAAHGKIKLVTLAPEWPSAIVYIDRLIQDGVAVAIGHTAASPERIRDAVSAGATLSTHLGNATHKVLPKISNYIWEQLAEDGLHASFIADGVHLPNAFLKSAVRAKQVERCILVTDAVMPAMCDPGEYLLGEIRVELKPDGRVVRYGTDRLAGSTLRMDHAITNVMDVCGIQLHEAIAMATSNPARVGRIVGRQKGLARGERADVVKFRVDEETGELHVLETWLAGKCVYQAGGH